MPVPATTDESLLEDAQCIRELIKEGYTPPGIRLKKGQKSSVTEAARRRGYSTRRMRERVAEIRHRGLDTLWEGLEIPEPEEVPPVTPVEQHNSGFWRRRAKQLEKQIGEAEHLIEELSGLSAIHYQVPDWLTNATDYASGKSAIGCLLSDIHMGEEIQPEEILGINAFNVEICRQRLRRYFTASCVLGQKWASDTDCQGVLLALAGDLISGDIHEELRITNALTSHEQVQAVVEEIELGIKWLCETFGRVHVVAVPGNHGRTTFKSTAKLYARLSYDIHVASVLASHFRNDDRVTFQYGPAKDQLTPIFGRTVLTTHGDKIGTRGGMGFAGPMLPIVRGSKKIEAQQASVGRRPDLIQFGHYHTTGNPGMVLANGSVPGYSEFADDLRAVVEPPQQWLYLLHSRWWLRERTAVQLEEPVMPEKPRVAVPAGWNVRA